MDALNEAFDRIRQRIEINDRGCWIWLGSTVKDMYGQIKVGGKSWSTHRVTYTVAKGAIPRGTVVRHTCDDGRCCNPAHLIVGDHEDNVQDSIDRGRHAARRVLTADEVQMAHTMRIAGATKRAIADALHCNWYAVSAAIDAMPGQVKRQGRPKGSRNVRTRIGADVKQKICSDYATGRYTQAELASKYQCDQTYVSLIVRNKV